MMKFSMKKVAAVVMAMGAVLAVSIGSASAAAVFTINPLAIGGTGSPGAAWLQAPFNATVFGGTSSELLHLNATGNSGFGWVQILSASNGSSAVDPTVSGLNVDYRLYLQFFVDTTLLTGTNGGLGSTYKINTLNFNVFADKNKNTTFTQADATTNQEAVVGGTTSDDILLAFGSLIPNAGTATITSLGGAALNSINIFAVCNGVNTASAGGVLVTGPGCAGNTGSNYFMAPNPFYQLALSGFNNASGGVHKSGNLVDVQDAVAALTFSNVPEPGSLALLGVALAGLSLTSRRKSAGK